MLSTMETFPDELAAHLHTASYGRAHRHHEVTGSTNDDASAWLSEGGASGLLVTADRQQAGRGTKGRPWSSPEVGDIYASVGIRLCPPPSAMGAVALATGLAIAEGIESAVSDLGQPIDLKWPNDLQVGGRKLAGILCESRWGGESVELVIGFGVNCGRSQFEDELASSATSLILVSKSPPPPRARLLAAICEAIELRCGVYFAEGFESIRGPYERRCVTLGTTLTVPVTRPDGSSERIHARAECLDDDGALLVRSLGGGALLRVDQVDVIQASAG